MKPVVAIDGPSGAGKSTVARMLALELGYVHLDTGAMYRAVALAANRAGVDYADNAALDRLCSGLDLKLEPTEDGVRVLLGGEDVTGQIRSPQMSRGSSAVSAIPEVRKHMVNLQRQVGRGGAVVAEGRDMGTVVFAGSRAKFYLDASVEERARRRHMELGSRGITQPMDEVMAEMLQRDLDDSSREHSPLSKAPDAVYVDTTGLTPKEVVQVLAGKVRELEAGS